MKQVDTPKDREGGLHGLAICAGVGGLELGVGLAVDDYECVGYIERDSFAAAALVARMEEETLAPAPIWDDLATFDGKPWRGLVDIVSAGFPCQPFSVAGKKLGTEDERWLWPDIERVLGEIQPRWVILENVPGLVRHGLWSVLGGLASLGYDAEWSRFSASRVGAGHERARIFILARQQVGDLGDATGGGAGRFREKGETLDGVGEGFGGGVGFGGSSENMADPRSERLEGGRGGSTATPTRRGGLPLFPPGPTDSGGWASVLLAAPELAPALPASLAILRAAVGGESESSKSLVRRVAHGLAEKLVDPLLAFRTDRLRVCGNGVHPLAAAYAVRSLEARRRDWVLNSDGTRTER